MIFVLLTQIKTYTELFIFILLKLPFLIWKRLVITHLCKSACIPIVESGNLKRPLKLGHIFLCELRDHAFFPSVQLHLWPQTTLDA